MVARRRLRPGCADLGRAWSRGRAQLRPRRSASPTSTSAAATAPRRSITWSRRTATATSERRSRGALAPPTRWAASSRGATAPASCELALRSRRRRADRRAAAARRARRRPRLAHAASRSTPSSFIIGDPHRRAGTRRCGALARRHRPREAPTIPAACWRRCRVTTPDGALVDAPIVDGLVRDATRPHRRRHLGNGCARAPGDTMSSTGRLAAQDADLGGRALQRLRFTYDPDGKLVRALDLAQDGPGARPARRGERAARLPLRRPRSPGRGDRPRAPGAPARPRSGAAGTIHGARHLSLNNGAALERYTQRFTYDVAGNLASASSTSVPPRAGPPTSGSSPAPTAPPGCSTSTAFRSSTRRDASTPTGNTIELGPPARARRGAGAAVSPAR